MQTELPIHFVSGMPRSGSTLLMNLLGQNPNHHVTPTNDLIDLLLGVRDHWQNTPGFRSQGLWENILPRVRKTVKHMIYGFYEQEFDSGKIIFDKSRGWIHNISMLEEALGRKIWVIVTVRDVRDMIASLEKVHRKSAMIEFRPTGNEFLDNQTVGGRADVWLSKGGVVGRSINGFRNAMDCGMQDRLIIIPYKRLTTAPKETVNGLHEVLGLPAHDYNPDNVEQITKEDDSVHGMQLHVIRPKVEPEKGPGWKDILPEKVASWIESEYQDINELANL